MFTVIGALIILLKFIQGRFDCNEKITKNNNIFTLFYLLKTIKVRGGANTIQETSFI